MKKVSETDMVKALVAYTDHLKDNLEFLQDVYPPNVLEAYKITIQITEILADPNTDENKLRETIFAKVPKKKIEWARKIIDRWVTRDERKAKVRQREKDRRERNKGKLEERKLSEKKNQELYEKFETMRILRAVDALDRIRPIISDECNPGEVPKPPELRDKLLELHRKAHDIINQYDYDTDLGMFDLAWEIEDELSEISVELDEIRKTVDDLIELCPSDEEDDEYDEYDGYE